jgi:hypothetical protein
MSMLDAWTNVFAAPGTRTMGNGKQDIAIIGPQWTGKLPRAFFDQSWKPSDIEKVQ